VKPTPVKSEVKPTPVKHAVKPTPIKAEVSPSPVKSVKSAAPAKIQASEKEQPSKTPAKAPLSPAKKAHEANSEVKVLVNESSTKRSIHVKSKSPVKTQPKRSESLKKSVSPSKTYTAKPKSAPAKPVVRE